MKDPGSATSLACVYIHKKSKNLATGDDSQDIADDANRPHVGGECHGVKGDDLGGDKLWGAKHDAHLAIRSLSGQAKVDYLDLKTRSWETEYVLRLQHKMKNDLEIHVFDIKFDRVMFP